MRRLPLTLSVFLLYNFCLGQPTLPEGFIAQQIVSGINPVALNFDPNGRLFITELTGNILLVENDIVHDEPVGVIPVDNTGERGLYGIAFDPDFEFNQYIYLYYSVQNANYNRLSRFKLHDNHIHYEEEEILMEFDFTTAVIHNGGDIKFGPDGKLYIAVGDGGTPALAQSQNSLFGKILRINPDGSVPTDNPFYTTNQGIYKSIYAYGLRNPFTFDFNGDTLFASDVGQSDYEEINNILPGKNYGWPIVEGMLSSSGVAPPENYIDPVYTYSHAEGCAITGAAFYNPQVSVFPDEFKNKYFFGDYCNNTVKALDPEAHTASLFLENGNGPTFIKVSDQGEMYIGSFGGGNQGSVWKITYSTDGSPRIAVHPESVIASVSDTVTFSVTAMGDALLHYQWQRNGSIIADATASALQLKNVTLSDNDAIFTCIVENEKGQATSQAAKLTVTARTRPEPAMGLSTYAGRSLYIAGDTIIIKGSASDDTQGTLPSSALSWKVDFHHDHHSHPILTNIKGTDSVAFIVPRVGETSSNVWYRVHLEAQNEVGLSKSTYTDIYPLTSTITVTTSYDAIAPFPVFLDGALHMTPFTLTAVAGMTRNLSIANNQVVGNDLYTYRNTNESSSSFTFNVPANDTAAVFTGTLSKMFLGRGQGLLGKYYNNRYFSGPHDNTRIDQHLDFDWGFQPPIENLSADNYSIIWEGYIRIPVKDAYTFYASFDNGLSLSVSDELLIDKLIDETDPEYSATTILEEGIHPIKIHYYEASSAARMKLSWESSSILKEIIPKASLFDQYYSPEVILTSIDSFKINGKLYATASAKDFEGNSIAAERFKWSVDFVSNDISSTIATIEGSDALEYKVPDHLNFFDSYLRINVTVTDNSGFTASMSKNALPILSSESYGVKLFPNPGTGIFNLNYIGPQNVREIHIYNHLGKLVQKKNFSANDNHALSIDLTNAPAGMYLTKILVGNSLITQTIVKN
jgi:glucose/arabinose dehydrogenase